MSLNKVLRQILDAWELRMEPILEKFFFFFAPPMERKAFLKSALIVMTVHRAVSAALLYCLAAASRGGNAVATALADTLAVIALLLFLLPFAAVMHRRLQWLGVSFAGMGLVIVATLAAAMWLLPGNPYWHPFHLVFQAAVIGLLSCGEERIIHK